MLRENKLFKIKDVGARLRVAMEQAGYNQTEMAEMIGVSRVQLHHYMKGNNMIPPDKLVLFASEIRKRAIKYGSLDYILYGDEPGAWVHTGARGEMMKDKDKYLVHMEKENERLQKEVERLGDENKRLGRLNQQLTERVLDCTADAS